MKILENIAWVYYVSDPSRLDADKCGKWMYFFSDKEFVANVCRDVVEKNIVVEAKHSNAEEGVACFYLNSDDIETHKEILTYFVANKLIRKTQKGRLYNISFKFDNQTRAGEYGEEFTSNIKLSNFIDLDSGIWIL